MAKSLVFRAASGSLQALAFSMAAAALVLGCTTDGGPQGSGSAGNAGNTNVAGQGSGGSAIGSSGAPGSGSSSGGNAGMSAAGAGAAGMGAGGGGTGGGGAGGSGGASPAVASPGCGMAAGQELDDWIEQPMLNVAGIDRQWWVWLPENYDVSRPYPLIFNFHGCSNSNNIVPMQGVSGDDAILVRGTGITDNVCWDAGAEGDDLTFFDQMLADVSAKRCVDTSRVFATGYSSGSWLANMLECERGDKLRAIGTVSGGTFGNKDSCVGKFARIFVHDEDDDDNRLDQGNETERDRLLEQNNCMAENPVAEDPAPCVRYQGCDLGYPVIWCQTQGEMHGRQDDLAPAAFWKLFSSL